MPIDAAEDSPELIPLLTADEAHFRATLPAFAMQAGVDAMRGNAVIALGNSGDPAAVDALAATLRHEKPQLRGYTAWALGRLGGEKARRMLAAARARETDAAVIGEIDAALANAGSRTE